VGVGFRCWLAGYKLGDTLGEAWRMYGTAFGPHQAKLLIADLAYWLRAVKAASRREIETFPAPCRGFCRDERVAISMIAASQHNARPALHACAFALLGYTIIDEVVDGSESFAVTLRAVDQALSPASICDAAHLASSNGLLH
jgi:hypothetical protein